MPHVLPSDHNVTVYRNAVLGFKDEKICIIRQWVPVIVDAVPHVVIILVLKYQDTTPVQDGNNGFPEKVKPLQQEIIV
jgi:hypothetical protein